MLSRPLTMTGCDYVVEQTNPVLCFFVIAANHDTVLVWGCTSLRSDSVLQTCIISYCMVLQSTFLGL